ncbi:hypothetical protein EVAR_71321_1 [Eumeta japonica]|uniref:Uncharacterized protein n=1 Tax=Eumeta variegata TaxID=151549 RepID=A0A4C1T9H9_EUMVA|nr:hypothetical protein EVAR_71321_1 [Eumeta japonica]
MAELRKLSEANIKDEEESAIKRNIDNSDKIILDREDEKMAIQNVGIDDKLKRYSLNELLSLRNARLSIHYPQCAIRPELQVFSVWTCRLRCELQYLGLWKIPNAGNAYGNCNCNGSCQSYACEGQHLPFHNSQAYSGTSQICYSNVPNSVQVHPILSSSPTMGTKKAERSREPLLNYQRNINTELIRATSPSGDKDGSLHYVSNQSTKPAFIDHRSISSSHLMPAFAKRRMGHANVMHGQVDAGSHYNTSGNNAERLSNDGTLNENSGSNSCESSVRPRKESVKSANDSSDYHLYKTSVKERMIKSEQVILTIRHLIPNQVPAMLTKTNF